MFIKFYEIPSLPFKRHCRRERTDGGTDGRTDEKSIPPTGTVCGGCGEIDIAYHVYMFTQGQAHFN